MQVYAAFKSIPDYHGPPPTLVSLHETLVGAMKALYPDESHERFRNMFTERRSGVWEGPDGFGLVRLMEVQP